MKGRLTVLDPVVFGHFELRPAQRQLLKSGEPVTLGARPFDLLTALIQNRERVVTKEELLRQVWQGVVVEENNLTVHVSRLRKLLGSDAVSTINGTGYQFTLPVSDAERAQPPAPSTHADATAIPLPLPDKPSIAVLPFARMQGDATHEDFIDGITDELITALSRFHSLFVISRNSVFTYKNRMVDARTVSHELGVRYVLEGSAHRADASVRVAVQLVDAVTGKQIWAERYDRQLVDMFALQDELARAIVTAMAPYLETTELNRARSRPIENVTAYELALQARARAREGLSRSHAATRDEVIRIAGKALALDPRCGMALHAIVDAHSWHLYFGTARSIPETLEAALNATASALAIDSADHLAYLGRGWLMLVTGRLPEASADFRRALDLNPNDPVALVRLGMCEAVSGACALGTRRCLEALRLSPRDPARFHLLDNLVWAQFASRSYAEAIDTARQSLREADFAGTHLCLVLCLVGAGDLPGAAMELQHLRQLAPAMVEARLSGVWLASDPDVRQREIDFLDAANAFRA